MAERVQKLIAQAGLCSRRAAEELLRQGRVRVNGAPAYLGQSAEETDKIEVDGALLSGRAACVYLMLHKPRGYVTTLSDERGRRTAAELVADCGCRVFPVGRLDMDSEGLLLFTNDGALMQALTHPTGEVDKVYLVTVTGAAPQEAARRLSQVREIDGERIRPAGVRSLSRQGEKLLLEITIHEGKNRQIRRMCDKVGLSVHRLVRIREHTLSLGDLEPGKWRALTDTELQDLQSLYNGEKTAGG